MTRNEAVNGMENADLTKETDNYNYEKKCLL